ncbi:hypothetical protein R3P38DRAFT_2776173 [Favolaschia claudopus]|uniref:Uncharacterized protein n=1 Tax=Favolaschia claudopus TaxID=2862362 RepID=A0AAW0BQL6_9AGAR
MNDTGKRAEEAAGRAGPEGRANRANLGGGDKEPGEHTRELGAWCTATHNRVKATGKGSDGGKGSVPEEHPKSQGETGDAQIPGGTEEIGAELQQSNPSGRRNGPWEKLQAKTRAKTEFQRHKEGEDGWGVGGHVIEPGDWAGGAGGPDEEPDIRGKVYQREREEEYSRSSAEPNARRRRAKPGILDERFRATARPEQPNLEDGMSSSFRKGSLDPNPTKELGKQRFRREPETGGGL